MWALCQAELHPPTHTHQRPEAPCQDPKATHKPASPRRTPAEPPSRAPGWGGCVPGSQRAHRGRSASLPRKEAPTPRASGLGDARCGLPQVTGAGTEATGGGESCTSQLPWSDLKHKGLAQCVRVQVCVCVCGVCVHACMCSQTRGEACAKTRQGIKGHAPMGGGDKGSGMCHRPPVSRSPAADHSHTLPRPVPSSGGSAPPVPRGLPKCWWGEGCTCPAGAGRGLGGGREEPRHQGVPFWDMQRGRGRSRAAMRVLSSGRLGAACTPRTT